MTIGFSIAESKPRVSSAPYISGDTFRSICNFIFDEDVRFDPAKIQKPSIVFVKTDMMPEFFARVHPKINVPYVLVTHNADHGAPGDFVNYLDDPKIIHWFGQNPTAIHPKFTPIPIGVANRYCVKISDPAVITKVRTTFAEKKHLLYVNVGTTHPERAQVLEILKHGEQFFFKASPKPFMLYLQDLSVSKFVLSPRGNGLDCHRTWEALLMDCIPIVKTSLLDPLFDGLPVLIVDDWQVVTKDFLEKKWQEFSQKQWCPDRMFVDYWINKIRAKLSEVKK